MYKALPTIIFLSSVTAVLSLIVWLLGTWLKFNYLTSLLIFTGLFLLILYSVGSIRIINQGNEGLIERLGRYHRKLVPGLNFIIPFMDTIVLEESTRERVFDITPHLTITKDGVPLEIGVVVFWRILQLERTYYSIEDIEEGLRNIIVNSLRSKVGRFELEKVFSLRDDISYSLLATLDDATATWGIKITRIEVGDILLAKAVLGENSDTIEFSFHNGIDWEAFRYSFNLTIENEGVELSIQGIEDKGDGVLVVKVRVPSNVNKAQIYKDFTTNYETAFKELEARYSAELKAKEGEIAIYREQSSSMWTVINSLANRPINVQAIAKAMNESTDQSQNINIGGNVTGSTINLGEISGRVSNTVAQLPSSPDSNQPGVKELLSQLQEIIEQEEELSSEDKADLLEQVKALAEVQQAPEQNQKEGLARKAKKMFEATLKSLPETAKIVDASAKLLPMILKLLGLPV